MKNLFISTISLFALVSAGAGWQGAQAADMPVKAPRMAAPASDPWTGTYAGVNIGWNGQSQRQTLTPQGLEPASTLADLFPGLGNGRSSSSGVIGGVQAGINQRFGSWVLGLEADISGLSGKTSRTASGVSAGGANFTVRESASTDVLMTARARAGFLVTPSTLVYATGGLAAARVQENGGATSFDIAGAPPAFNSFGTMTKWTPGWTAGGGVETQLGAGWSVKAEYLFTQLRNVNANSQQDNVLWANFVENYRATTDIHVVRVGLNHKLSNLSESRGAYASAAPVTFNWTGFYAGMNVGYERGHTRATEPTTEFHPGSGPWNAFGDSFQARTTGLVGGIQGGYNVQISHIVAGVEGDFGYLSFNGMHSSSLSSDTIVSGAGGLYGTFRGRVGFAWDRVLFYGTGGVIVANLGTGVNDDLALTPATTGILNTMKTGTQTGWVAGGGIEYALISDWSVKGEYLHFDFGNKLVSAEQENSPGDFYAFNIKNSGDMFRIGLNKKIY